MNSQDGNNDPNSKFVTPSTPTPTLGVRSLVVKFNNVKKDIEKGVLDNAIASTTDFKKPLDVTDFDVGFKIGEGRFVCGICPKTFPSMTICYFHLRRHSDNEWGVLFARRYAEVHLSMKALFGWDVTTRKRSGGLGFKDNLRRKAVDRMGVVEMDKWRARHTFVQMARDHDASESGRIITAGDLVGVVQGLMLLAKGLPEKARDIDLNEVTPMEAED